MLDDDKKWKARRKFTPDRGPLSEETRATLRQKMKEWHRRTRKGTEIGNALAAKARRIRKMGPLAWLAWCGHRLSEVMDRFLS